MSDVVTPEQSAMQQAQEFVRFLIGLGSAVIGFSTTLIDRAALKDTHFLLGIWILMGLSIVGGILCYSRSIVMLSKSKFSLTDRFLESPARVQQFAFVVGMLLMGWTLVVVAHDPTKVGDVSMKPPSKYSGIVDVIDAIGRMQRPLLDEELQISKDIGTSLGKLDRLSSEVQHVHEQQLVDVTRIAREIERDKNGQLASTELLRALVNEQTELLRNSLDELHAIKDRMEKLPAAQVNVQPLLIPKCTSNGRDRRRKSHVRVRGSTIQAIGDDSGALESNRLDLGGAWRGIAQSSRFMARARHERPSFELFRVP
jgi:hypothetical protein